MGRCGPVSLSAAKRDEDLYAWAAKWANHNEGGTAATVRCGICGGDPELMRMALKRKT